MLQPAQSYEDRPRRPYEPPQGSYYHKKKKTLIKYLKSTKKAGEDVWNASIIVQNGIFSKT